MRRAMVNSVATPTFPASELLEPRCTWVACQPWPNKRHEPTARSAFQSHRPFYIDERQAQREKTLFEALIEEIRVESDDRLILQTPHPDHVQW